MFGHTKILHTLIRMGSAAGRGKLSQKAAVPDPGKAFEFPARDKEVLKEKEKKEEKKQSLLPYLQNQSDVFLEQDGDHEVLDEGHPHTLQSDEAGVDHHSQQHGSQ